MLKNQVSREARHKQIKNMVAKYSGVESISNRKKKPRLSAASASLDIINKWAEDNTNGKIPKVLDQLSPDLVLVLMNALYFKGDWSKQFTESATKKETFYLSDSVTYNTDYMNSDIAVTAAAANGLQVIEIPYGRKNFAMVLVVPSLPLQEQYDKLNAETWLTLTSALSEQNWDSATVILPKFTFSFEKYLNQNEVEAPDTVEESQIVLRQLEVSQEEFIDKSIGQFRGKTGGMVVGIERNGKRILNPESNIVLGKNDSAKLQRELDTMHFELKNFK
jgi:hypothetical protein